MMWKEKTSTKLKAHCTSLFIKQTVKCIELSAWFFLKRCERKKPGPSWRLTALRCLFNEQWRTVSFQREFFSNDVKGKNLDQGEGSLYFPVYWINSELQWAFSLSFFKRCERKNLDQAEGSLYFPVYSINSEEQWVFSLRFFLNDVKGKNLKLKAYYTLLWNELDQRAEELQQKQQERNLIGQNRNSIWATAWAKVCIMQLPRVYYWRYFKFLSKVLPVVRAIVWRATTTELDTNEVTTEEGNTIAVLPHY